jgi:uncharacterized protein (TIGR02444 family)
MSNPLWEFSLTTYRVEGVAETCVGLQDTFGLDVNLLLYAAWLARLHQRIDERHLRELSALIDDWRTRVVQPLRALRRQLAGYEAAASLRDELKILELRAEREQQQMMYAFHQCSSELRGARDSLRHNLSQVAHFSSQDEQGWASDIEHLASLISL